MSTTESTGSSSESGRSSPRYTTRHFVDEEWEAEEEEEESLVEEFREVWQLSHTVSAFDDTGDSLDNDDSEQIRAKLRALREYVRDLQSSYEELLDTFSQLESAARDRVASLEQQLVAQAKDFQQRHELLEQQVASLRAGSTSSPMDQQTQTDVQSVLDAVEQDTAGVLATVDGLYTGVMKLSLEGPLLSQPVSGSSCIPPASSMEQDGPHVSTQQKKEEEKCIGLVSSPEPVGVPDQGHGFVNFQESLPVSRGGVPCQHTSTTDGPLPVNLGSGQEVEELGQQGIQVGGGQYQKILEPVGQPRQRNAAPPPGKQRPRSDHTMEEQGLGFVNQETVKQGYSPLDQTRHLSMHEHAQCFVEEEGRQEPSRGSSWQQHAWVSTGSPHQSDESDGALAELLEKDCRIAVLETCVQGLEHDLQEARHHQLTSSTIANQEEAEVVSVRRELHQLRCQRGQLDEEVEKTRQELLKIQQKREQMQVQVDQLQQRMHQATAAQTKPTEMEDGKEKLHTQSVAVQVELSVQQALLETSQVESMEIRERQEEAEQSYREVAHQMSEAKSQLGEAKTRCHQLEVAVAGKELEIQRLMSAIHTSKAQLTSMSLSDDGDSDSDHSSLASDSTGLSPREQVAQGLEEAMASHTQQWTRTQGAIKEHHGVIAELQGRETQLNSEISRQEARVIQLEALLQERQVGDSSKVAKLSSTQAELELLHSLLLRTREEHVAACNEVSALHDSLAQTVGPLLESLHSVKGELFEKSQELKEARAQQEQLQTEYVATCLLIEAAEQGKLEVDEKWKMAVRELDEQHQSIALLEEELAGEHQRHVDDVDQQAAAIAALSTQLDLLDEEHSSHSQELLSLASERTALQGKLEKRDHLLETLQQQTSQLLQQHKEALQEVQERGEFVKELENDLCVTQTLCDALQQEVSDGQDRITDLQQQLQDSHHHQLQLTHQLHQLQEEAEEACHSLETVLRQNSIQCQHSGTTVRTLETHLDAERSVASRLHQRVTDLLGTTKEQQGKIRDLQELARELDADNSQLRADQQWREETITSLQHQVERGGHSDRVSHELTETRIVIEQLQRLVNQKDEELIARESQRLMLEALAQERLQEVTALQQQLYHASSRTNRSTVREKMLETDGNLQHTLDLQLDVESLCTMYEEKCVELQRLRTEHRLLVDKEAVIDQQLEECRREVRLCKERASQLETQYSSTLDELAQCQTELAAFKELSTLEDATRSLHHQLKAGKQSSLESLKLKEAKRKLQEKEAALTAAEEEKRGLLHRLSTLEEHHNSLIRSHSQLKLDLGRVRAQLREQRQKNQEAQTTDQLSRQRMASAEAPHVKSTMEQEDGAASLKSSQLLPPADESTLVQSSLYQAVLEKGLSSGSAFNTSGYSSPTDQSEDLDKQYWIRRSSELSLQLQDSSEFWTGKVRELSYQLEKYETGQN